VSERLPRYAYTVLLDPWEEGSGYTVTVPALPGCITQGKTKAEALARAREAIACHVKGLLVDGEEVPFEKRHPILTKVAVEL